MYEKGSCSKSSLYVNDDFTNNEIHVLLVHRDQEISTFTCNKLKSCSIKVTTYQCAQSALSVVAAGNKEFDLMLIDADSIEPTDPFTALGFATAMNLPTILISSKNYDYNLARRAYRNGALNLLTHPISEETVRYCLWYPMMQKKVSDGNNINQRSISSRSTERPRENIPSDKKNGPDMLSNRRKYTKTSDQDLRWTDELRQKFWNAVNQLDDGSCVPKKIVEMMGVPGLTRTQVASYLQKCRYEIKQQTLAAAQPESSGESVMKRRNLSAFGAKPVIPNVGINISSNNRSRYTRLIYPQQPSAETPHLGANRVLMNAGKSAADPVDTEATISISEAPESSSAGEKRPLCKLYTFLPSKEEENDR